MEGKRKPGIYLVTDTGAEIELILADADRQETLLSKRTPAEDLVAFVNRDFSEYQRKVNALWETHPLFEPHNDVLLSEYLDFIAKALPLTEMIRELDPAAYLDVTLQAAQAQAMEDNGDPLFLSRKGAAIGQALSTPFRIQNRQRNLFEIVFAYSERDTQQERFQTLEQTWPGIIDRDYAVRFIPQQDSKSPVGTKREYHPDGLYELYLVELSLYFQQSKKRIARCENCWRYFVPRTTAETRYCDGEVNGVPCKKAGPNNKRKLEADLDPAVDTYNHLRRSLSECVKRYEVAAPWERENMVQFDGQQYNAWIVMAQEMKKRYLADEITAEEFLSAIDVFDEIPHEARKLERPDPKKTLWHQSIMQDIDFDPAREFSDMDFLDTRQENAQWTIITSEQRRRWARGGYDGLHALYGGDTPVDLSESIHDDTVSIPEEDQEIIRILRNAVQDYRETWDKDQS